ncbi:MAG TPA: serine/threonine protein kinase [Planctomycetaceae bacterium]|nr:serine/threonine protein kinase [Planctomycetaceae bacterium]
MVSLLLRKELLTNWQLERITIGKRDGYFYGNYKILYLVGTGTFARVYRAVDVKTDKVVAVKVLRMRYSGDLRVTEQFLREAKLQMPLNHPNIVPVYVVSTDRSRPFMVMEFVEGRNLRDFLKIRERMELKESMQLVMDVVSGLEYAYEQGLTHRDVKLSNVLITGTGRAKLVDFGLATMIGEIDDEFEGTLNPRSVDYAGLERSTRVDRNDVRSDLYFTGCMLYAMLSGRAPLVDTRDRIKRMSLERFRGVVPISKCVPDLPSPVVAVVHKAMELNPSRRYQNPTELLRDLKKASKRVEDGDIRPVRNPERGFDREITDEGQSRRVMIIESRVPMQDLFRKKLKERGYRVLVFGHPDRAIQRFEDDQEVADCVIFCASDLGVKALEAFNQFGENELTKQIPAILFVDQNQQSLVEHADVSRHRVILSMPIRLRQLRSILLKLFKAKEKAESSVEA